MDRLAEAIEGVFEVLVPLAEIAAESNRDPMFNHPMTRSSNYPMYFLDRWANEGESNPKAASAATPRTISPDLLATLTCLSLAQADLFFAGTGTPAIFTLTEKSVLLVVK